MTIPIYVFGMLATVIVAYLSDKYQQRTPFIMGGFTLAVLGFIALLAIPHPHYSGVTYFFLFFVAAGLYCPFVCIVTLVGNNLAPSGRRAVGMALLISMGNLGGIAVSSTLIRTLARTNILAGQQYLLHGRRTEVSGRIRILSCYRRCRHYHGLCSPEIFPTREQEARRVA
jgi:MFS family permease